MYADPSGELFIADVGMGSAEGFAAIGVVGATGLAYARHTAVQRTKSSVPVPNTRSRAVSSKNSAASKAEEYRRAKTQAVQKVKNEDIRTSATAKTIAQGKAEKRRTYDPLNAPTVSKGSVETFPSNNVEKARNEGIKARKPSLNGDGSDGGCTVKDSSGDTQKGEVTEESDSQTGQGKKETESTKDNTRLKGETASENNGKRNKIPDDKSTSGHIFQDKEGHVQDTPYNRALLEDVANNAENFCGTDQYGNEWYVQYTEDGRQIWVEARNGRIFEGGINDILKIWDPNTGFKQPYR